MKLLSLLCALTFGTGVIASEVHTFHNQNIIVIFRSLAFCMQELGDVPNAASAKAWLKESLRKMGVSYEQYKSFRDSDPIRFTRLVERNIENQGGCASIGRQVDLAEDARNSQAPTLNGADPSDPFQW